MSKSSPTVKSFQIPKQLVSEAYKRVKANKGAAGVDGQWIEDFEADLKGNLYKIWNRMSSGTYFPPAVRAVEIPKPHGWGDQNFRYFYRGRQNCPKQWSLCSWSPGRRLFSMRTPTGTGVCPERGVEAM